MNGPHRMGCANRNGPGAIHIASPARLGRPLRHPQSNPASKSTERRCRSGAAAFGGTARARLQCSSIATVRRSPFERAFSGRLGAERTPYARMTSEPEEQYLCIVSTASSGSSGQPRERAHGSPAVQKCQQMKARGRGVSQGWALSETQQRVQVRGCSPAESFRE